MSETTYKIIRFHRDSENPVHLRVIKRGLTLEEAQAHCDREDTHEMGEDGHAIWFDGYDEE